MTWMPPYSATVWKAIIGCVAGLVLIGIVLFGFSKCSTYLADRKAEQLKTNVNLAINAIQAAQSNKQVDDIDRAVKMGQLNQAVNEAINAANTTDEAKKATNQALANVNAAVAANRPVGTTGSELSKQLDGLNIQ